MARNAAPTYGVDIACLLDADELFSPVTGIDLVRQDAYHRITCDNVLGDDGTGSSVITGWGFDCRRLAGLPASQLPAHQAIIADRLKKDPRILSASVRLTSLRTNGVDDVEIQITCETALGSFDLIKRVSQLVAADLVGVQP